MPLASKSLQLICFRTGSRWSRAVLSFLPQGSARDHFYPRIESLQLANEDVAPYGALFAAAEARRLTVWQISPARLLDRAEKGGHSCTFIT